MAYFSSLAGHKTRPFTLAAILSLVSSTFACAQDSTPLPEFRDHPFFQFDTDASRTADIALADVDGDGDLDALVANGRHWAEQDFIFLNSGSGRFLEANFLGSGLEASYAHLVADFNMDGKPDVVTLGDQIPARIRLNEGSGQYGAPLDIDGTDGHVRSGIVFDANNDGYADIAIATRRGADLVLIGDGAGKFPQIINLPGDGRGSTGLAAGDFNGDGYTDLVVARRDDSPSVVMINMAGSTFQARPLNGSLGDHRKAITGDFDDDGALDILLVSTEGDHKLYTDTRSEDLGSPYKIDRSGHATQSIAAADLNKDGHLDLVEGNDGVNYMLLNSGKNDFSPYPLSEGKDDTYGVTIGDMNNDGDVDIVIANSGSANQVFIQR